MSRLTKDNKRGEGAFLGILTHIQGWREGSVRLRRALTAIGSDPGPATGRDRQQVSYEWRVTRSELRRRRRARCTMTTRQAGASITSQILATQT